jgi:hypothetical protein
LPVLPYVDVCSPPELLTFIFGTPSPLPVDEVLPEDEVLDGVGSVDVPLVEVSVPEDVDVPVAVAVLVVVVPPEVDGPAADDDAVAPSDPPDAAPSDSWSVPAHATPGVGAAIPTPSDTASAPTRPTYLA